MISADKCVWTTILGFVILAVLVDGAAVGRDCQSACATGSAESRTRCNCLSVGGGSDAAQQRRKRTVDYDFLSEPASYGSYADPVSQVEEIESPEYSKLFRWGRSGPSVFRWGKRSGSPGVFRWGKRSDEDYDYYDSAMEKPRASVFRWGKRGGGSSKVFRWGKRDGGSSVPVFRWGKRDSQRSKVFRWGKRSAQEVLADSLHNLRSLGQ